MNDRPEDDQQEHRERLREILEARARGTPDEKIILGSGLIDNAVDEALHIMAADEPHWTQIGDILRDGEVDRAEVGLKAFFNSVSDSLDSSGGRRPAGKG